MAWYDLFSKFKKESKELSIISNLASEDEYHSIIEEEEGADRAEAIPLTLNYININDPIDIDLTNREWAEEAEEVEFEEEIIEETEEERIQRELDDIIDEIEYVGGESSARLIKYMYDQIKEMKEKQSKYENEIHSLEEQLASIEFYKE
ncbi:MAG: hypothetical protein PHY47_00080 [Lachnospiraceae bacterium]|nr:hypothetical protein [Lachnospiraceae bacterium]